MSIFACCVHQKPVNFGQKHPKTVKNSKKNHIFGFVHKNLHFFVENPKSATNIR